MKYIDLKERLKDFSVFSIRDIEKIDDKKFYGRRLNEWQSKNYLKKIIRGYYIFSGININEELLFEVANKIYSPSYITFETALGFYNLIPEAVYGITSASTRKTNSFKTPLAEFSYRKIDKKLFFGYLIKNNGNKSYKIASMEKAILDYFYLNPILKKNSDFESLRINRNNFFEQINKDKLFNYLDIFSNKSLSKRIKNFFKYLEND
jgi:predicted transcriptional regulator of viral defense system